LGVLVTARPEPSCTNHAQPEPNWLTPASLNFALKSSKDPNALLIASARSPLGSPPPSGESISQNNEWL
jgi:hypothetical protein